MKKYAESVNLHHVPERQPRRLCHQPRRSQSSPRARHRYQSQSLLTLLFVQQRLEHHHNHAEDGENNLGKNPDVIGALRKSWREGYDHCATILLATCANGVSAAFTAGSIAPSHTIGATPITSAAAAQGQIAIFSKPERSARESLIGCVTLP